MIIEGKESIDVSFCDDMQIKSFDENRDFVELTGEEKATVNLINKGDFSNLLSRRCSSYCYYLSTKSNYKKSYL